MILYYTIIVHINHILIVHYNHNYQTQIKILY